MLRAVLAIAQSRGRVDGVQGPGRDCVAPRRPAAPHQQPCRQRGRCAPCPPVAKTRGWSRRCGSRRSPCSGCLTWSAPRSTSSPPRLSRRSLNTPDHEIITSFPGLGDISGAIVLAEIGDDRSRFRDDRALQAFAGSAPVTRASGKSRTVTPAPHEEQPARRGRLLLGVHRRRPPVTDPRSLPARRREHGDGHPAALGRLFNKMLGQLHHACGHAPPRLDQGLPTRPAATLRSRRCDRLGTSEVSSDPWCCG